MSLSTHVLDTTLGAPAVGVAVRCERADGDGWTELARGETDVGGRVSDLLGETTAGHHRLTFAAGDWFARQDRVAFWGDIVVAFEITEPSGHHHVPLLLSPFGYSTYRGS